MSVCNKFPRWYSRSSGETFLWQIRCIQHSLKGAKAFFYFHRFCFWNNLCQRINVFPRWYSRSSGETFLWQIRCIQHSLKGAKAFFYFHRFCFWNNLCQRINVRWDRDYKTDRQTGLFQVSIPSILVPDPIILCISDRHYLVLSFFAVLERLAAQSKAQRKLQSG